MHKSLIILRRQLLVSPHTKEAFARPYWEQALASGATQSLLSLDGYHFTDFPSLAPVFADLKRQLRFSDLPDNTRACFVREVLTVLSENGEKHAREQCSRAITQLESEYAQRHKRAIAMQVASASTCKSQRLRTPR